MKQVKQIGRGPSGVRKTAKRASKRKMTEREARVRAICGKYAFVRTSSEAFLQRKREELELEEH